VLALSKIFLCFDLTQLLFGTVYFLILFPPLLFPLKRRSLPPPLPLLAR
jgi:hypothetical protein